MVAKEQRKFPRVNYPCSVTIWRDDGGSDVIMANTSNISIGGLCFHVTQKIAPETIIDIKIDNFFEGQALKCRGKVLRCDPDPATADAFKKFFSVGVEFIEVVEAQEKYLRVFVQRLIDLDDRSKKSKPS